MKIEHSIVSSGTKNPLSRGDGSWPGLMLGDSGVALCTPYFLCTGRVTFRIFDTQKILESTLRVLLLYIFPVFIVFRTFSNVQLLVFDFRRSSLSTIQHMYVVLRRTIYIII